MPLSTDEGVDFQFLAEHSVDIICRAGVDRVLRYISPSSFAVLGWKPEEMAGRLADDFILPEDLPVVAAAIAAKQETVTFRVLKADGSTAWMESRARLVHDSVTGKPREWVASWRDVSAGKILEERLSAQALTDGLTGLANRRAFDEAFDREWSRTLREGSQIPLLLLDLDHFKLFNDRYGHQAGDDCLRTVAIAVRGAIRATDMVARYGGEEIAVILPSTETAGAVRVAEKVRCAIVALRISHEGNPEGGGWVSVSIGAATGLARQGGTMRMPESLLVTADNALYKAKHEGRNRVATALLIAPRDS